MFRRLIWHIKHTGQKLILEEFIDKAMLSAQEKFIMESRVKGRTVTEQVLYLKVSESTV